MTIAALGRFVLRHKLLVAASWGLVLIASLFAVSSAIGALSQEFTLPGREGSVTSQKILQTYGNGGLQPPLVPVVTLPAGTTVESPGIRDELAALDTRVRQVAPQARLASFASTGDRAFVSANGRTTYSFIFVSPGPGFGESPVVVKIRQIVATAAIAGAPVHLTGYNELQTGGSSGGQGVFVETLIGGAGALVVLAWVFGSFLALLPLAIAAISILTTFLVIWGLTTVTDVSFIVEYLVSLIGLGVAIDYSLLIVTRWREERAAGRSNEEAVLRSMETAGHAVLFSGLTVAVGLLALVVLPVPFLRSIGYGGMLIPLVSVLVAITLLPVVLATIGPRLDWPRLRARRQTSPLWLGWSRLMVRWRWLAAAVAIIVLVALIVPAFSITVGDPRADALARSGPAGGGLEALEQSGLGSGVLLPFEVLSQGTDPATVAAALGKVEGVAAAIAPGGESWRRAGTAVVAVVPAADSNSPAGKQTLQRVRHAAHELSGHVTVGGPAAQNADFIDAVYSSFPLMIALIAIVTFILLARAFHSLLLPLKALIFNGLSIGAAFGVLVLVWQEGHGAHLIWGYQATGAITAFIPLVVFAFLFGLSMDYEVFILTRIREEYDDGHANDDAIVQGLGLTGRLVTSAALILFLAFAALGSAPVIVVKILATGLAVGILLDATVVRAVLLPATVSLLGHWNWWVPARLHGLFPPTRAASLVANARSHSEHQSMRRDPRRSLQDD